MTPDWLQQVLAILGPTAIFTKNESIRACEFKLHVTSTKPCHNGSVQLTLRAFPTKIAKLKGLDVFVDCS